MSYEQIIYNALTDGTPTNAGLPPTLANLVVAQSKHESANYQSNIFKTANNAFGYTYVPGAAWQSGAGVVADNGLRVAKYASVADSAREIVDWLYRRVKEGKFPALNTITSPEQYASLLKAAGYYEDTYTNYVKGLKAWLKDISSSSNTAPLLIGIVLLILLLRK